MSLTLGGDLCSVSSVQAIFKSEAFYTKVQVGKKFLISHVSTCNLHRIAFSVDGVCDGNWCYWRKVAVSSLSKHACHSKCVTEERTPSMGLDVRIRFVPQPTSNLQLSLDIKVFLWNEASTPGFSRRDSRWALCLVSHSDGWLRNFRIAAVRGVHAP